jgi:hypothetical protein
MAVGKFLDEGLSCRYCMLDASIFDASGKNKRLTKGKKGGKKKAQDAFARKELYAIKAPSIFATRNAGKTIVNKTYGTST